MTDNSNLSPWLKYQVEQTGKTVEQIRAEMSDRSKKANKSTSGFASMAPEKLKAAREKALKTRQAKSENKN